jgi:hypothetical protein
MQRTALCAAGDGHVRQEHEDEEAVAADLLLGAILLAVALHFLVPVRQLLVWSWRLSGIAPLVLGIVLGGGRVSPYS